MSGEMLTGQVTPASGEVTNAESAQLNAETTLQQTDGGEGGEGNKPEVPATKTFTQKEVDDIVKRAKAASESKAERRVMRTVERMLGNQQQAPQARPQPQQSRNDGRPARQEGETDDDYLERLTDWKLDQREQRQTESKQQEQQRTLAQKTERIYAEAQKLDGFDRDAFDELPLTKPMVEALIDSDDAPRLMHHMAANPAEVERIAQLSPARQAAELGKLEARMDAEAKAAAAAAEAEKTKPPQRSAAPQALAPVKGGGANSAPDPSDTAAWIKYQNAREQRALRGN